MSIRKGDVVISGSGSSGSAMNVDNRTTSLNINDEVQAIGLIEKNKSNVKYDWVGTESEWIAARSAGTIDDDWICYIVDDAVAVNKRQRTIGEIIYSLIPLDDPALHLLDGSLIDGTGVYNQFYTYMKNLYENGYDKCFTTEADWQASDATYGACGKFVLDVSNQTIRLPELQGFVEGTLDEDAIGELIEAGLPNITGGIGLSTGGYGPIRNSGNETGALYKSSNTYNGPQGESQSSGKGFGFDASRSNSIYGNSDTVQPQAIQGFYYIVLATDVNLSLTLDTDSLVNDVNHLQSEVSGADYVVEYQTPTSENNYTWYRLYKSGWIEQGGIVNAISTAQNVTVNFPKTMSDTNYCILTTPTTGASPSDGYAYWLGTIQSKATNSCVIKIDTTAYLQNVHWEVKGFTAS